MSEKQRDLMMLRAMAVQNIAALEPGAAAVALRQYREHKEKCSYLYGANATFDAWYYGLGFETLKEGGSVGECP